MRPVLWYAGESRNFARKPESALYACESTERSLGPMKQNKDIISYISNLKNQAYNMETDSREILRMRNCIREYLDKAGRLDGSFKRGQGSTSVCRAIEEEAEGSMSYLGFTEQPEINRRIITLRNHKSPHILNCDAMLQ
jgi:hypothetical protein